MIGFISLASFINFISTSYVAKISAKMTKDLRLERVNANFDTNWSFFTKRKSGEFVHSILSEAAKVQAGYNDSIKFVSAVLQAVVIFILTLFIDIYVASAGLFQDL